MSELLSEHYDDYNDVESSCCSHTTRSTRRTTITNILVWLDCYASLVAVLCSAYPDKFHQFMAYQKTNILAYRRFAGDGWVIYDSSFHRQAANIKSLDWGHMNSRLWNEIFTGRAKAVTRCRFCLSELHLYTDCPQAPDNRSQSNGKQGHWESRQIQDEICHLFNDRRGNRCNFHLCKFSHICSECSGRHPLSQCTSSRRSHPYPSNGSRRRQ